MKQIELKDFLEYKFLSNVKMSPDKKSCVFTVSTCDEENNSYNQNLYIWREGVCSQLTQSNKDSGALFLDDSTILFRSGRNSDLKEEVTSYYTISIHGGEAKKCFDIPMQVSSIELLNADEFLVNASFLKGEKEEKDYEVFTKIPFCHNGGGYAKNTVNRLYIYHSKTKDLKAISPEDLTVTSYEVNCDKSEIVVVANVDKKKSSMRGGLFTYSFATEIWKQVVEEKDYSIEDAHYFNGGILFSGNKEWKYGYNDNSRFFFVDKKGTVSLFCDNTESLWNSVGSDCRYGGGCQMKVSGDKFYFVSTKEHNSVILSLDAKGMLKEELAYDGSVDCFDVCDDTFYYIGMKDGMLQELFRKAEADEQLTSLNEEILREKYVASYEEVFFENDGYDFLGWVLLPKDYDESKKYPAIFDIHGGPKTAYGRVFYHEMQLWANMGYFVFFTNPRGSDGRGNEFADIYGKYGTIDYDDLMKFTDVVLEKYPAIDREKVGVTGGSYGGFMTNWIIGHTDRFACAATQRSISNWISFYGTSDIGMYFAEDQIHGNIFESPEKLWEHSPLKYAKNIVTPTLFIHSDEDYRCPIEQAFQLYTAMVDREIDARFVLFHGENHELSRGGKPKHRVRRLEEITNWMEKYLK